MPRIVPSQIVYAINLMFGEQSEIDRLQHHKRAEVHTLLELLDQTPSELIDLPFHDRLEFERCRAALATILPSWNLDSIAPAPAVLGKNAVERIRRLIIQCRDELPEPQSDFPFITDEDVRRGVEDRLRAARIDFDAREWLGATTSASVALEAMLLWRVKQGLLDSKKPPDLMVLSELIDVSREANFISEDAAKQCRLAQDARNLIHPGKVLRSGVCSSKSSALTAFAAVYRVAEELNRTHAAQS